MLPPDSVRFALSLLLRRSNRLRRCNRWLTLLEWPLFHRFGPNQKRQHPKRNFEQPHFRAAPVCQKSHAQPIMVSTAGNGYSHILKGSRSVPVAFARASRRPLPDKLDDQTDGQNPGNGSLQIQLDAEKNARAPSASSEKCGKCLVGCSRPKLGKVPIERSEYGTRE